MGNFSGYFLGNFSGYFGLHVAPPRKDDMKRTYYHKEGQRTRFWIRTPRKLWDWLPKIIARDLSAPDTTDIGSRCQACGQRLRSLFDRAVKGMVDRTLLRELVNEICDEALYTHTPPAEIVNIRQVIFSPGTRRKPFKTGAAGGDHSLPSQPVVLTNSFSASSFSCGQNIRRSSVLLSVSYLPFLITTCFFARENAPFLQ